MDQNCSHFSCRSRQISCSESIHRVGLQGFLFTVFHVMHGRRIDDHRRLRVAQGAGNGFGRLDIDFGVSEATDIVTIPNELLGNIHTQLPVCANYSDFHWTTPATAVRTSGSTAAALSSV